MNRSALFCLLLFIACAPSVLTTKAQAAPEQSAPVATEKLQAPPPIVNRLDLSGPNGRHITLSADALQSLPQQTVRVHNPHTKADETYQGVELSLLLARLDAPLGPKLRGNALSMYVVAEGTDKYRAIYSLAEIDPTFHTGTIIVADREDGQPIAKDGPFKLVNTEDKRPARWVRNLASIQLSSVP
jgi:hypothetical protein